MKEPFKKLLFIITLAVCVSLTSMSGTVVSADTHKHCVCGKDDCTGEGHDTEQGWIALPSGNLNYDNFHNDESLYTPFKCRYDESKAEYWYYLESGYYYLTGDIVFDEPLNIRGDNVVICLNGYNITRIEDYKMMDDQPFIEIIKDYSLTLTDCKKTPHYFEYSTDSEWKYYGYTAPETGKIDTLDTISDDTKYVKLFGGCIYGGLESGIHNAGGTVTLFNVNIVGNKSLDGAGGGILTRGKITMNGGNIVGNKSYYAGKSVGGGVRVSSVKDGDVDKIGEFIMNGGIIGYNLVDDEGQGSGVYVGFASNGDEIVGSKFIMTGGSITGNRGGENTLGSGIYALGDVTLTGNAKVQKNIGYWGVYIERFSNYGYIPNFTVGGNAQVTDNVSAPNGNTCNCHNDESYDSYITIGTGTNAPSDNMKIGISPCWDPFSESVYNPPYTFTTNGTSDDTKYFISDVDSVYVKANAENNKLQIVSRITEQPDISNNFTVTVDKKNPDVVPSYQWKEASGDNVVGETSNQFVSGVFGEDYLCRVTYADGSYEDSKTITFYPYFAKDITKTYGDANFTQTVKGNKTGITVTYSSSNPAVATVNSSTGEVTILKVGTTTIKAVSEETGTHKKAEATYILTVKSLETQPYKVVNTGVIGSNNNALKIIGLLSALGIATVIASKKKKY